MSNRDRQREQVMETLSSIEEPYLHRSFTELNLIRDVLLREGLIRLTVILYREEETDKEALKQEIENKLNAIGVQDVHIRFRAITDYEK